VSIAATVGLEALTVGQLADELDMSKSGLFAHFRSKEALQLVLSGGTRMLAHEAALRRRTAQTMGWRGARGGG